MSEDEVKKSTFNLEDYKINRAPEKTTITIEETGVSFDITTKELSWSKRNQLMAKCMKFDSKGNTNFEADTYVRAYLRELIVEAPWGATTESFLLSIDTRLGGALEKLVPSAFAEDNKVDEAKKEL